MTIQKIASLKRRPEMLDRVADAVVEFVFKVL